MNYHDRFKFKTIDETVMLLIKDLTKSSPKLFSHLRIRAKTDTKLNGRFQSVMVRRLKRAFTFDNVAFGGIQVVGRKCIDQLLHWDFNVTNAFVGG